MSLNPYESPLSEATRSNHLKRSQFDRLKIILLRIAAIGFWLSSLLPVVAFVVLVSHPEIIQRKVNPLLQVPSAIIVFALPTIGFLLLGVASWRREGRFAIVGLAVLVPISLIALLAFVQS